MSALNLIKNLDEYEHGTKFVATDFYDDDVDIPRNEIPDTWKNEKLDFSCWCSHTFITTMQNLFVDCDYFIPEATCPECGDKCYIKKWR